jgi:hypothetical protein
MECEFVQGQTKVNAIRTLAEIKKLIHVVIPPNVYSQVATARPDLMNPDNNANLQR